LLSSVDMIRPDIVGQLYHFPTRRSSGLSPKQPAQAEEVDWFERGLELEESDPQAALAAYERATRIDVDDAAAWINWGRLLHEVRSEEHTSALQSRANVVCRLLLE